MTRRTLVVAAALALHLALAAVPAAGTTIARTDPADTGSPLDLRRVRVSHEAAGEVVRIATRGGFRDGEVDGERGWIRIGFAGKDGWRRSVYVMRVEGELRGVVADRDGDFLRFVTVRRIARDRVTVHVPTTVSRGTPYRFAVWSVWNRRPCARSSPCVDWLPDAGTIRHAR